MKLSLLPVVLGLGMSSVLRAQVSTDCPKVVIDEVDLQGAIHLPGTVKEQLVASLRHREYEENSDWIGDVRNIVIRTETDGWPDRENQGYLGFSVEARWKALRREPGLLHVLVIINLDEGQQKRLKAITFRYVEAHLVSTALDSGDLRKLIPLNDGEVYNRDKFYAGLTAVARAYNERGFIGHTTNVEVDQTNQTVVIFVELNEGQQYRWGNIQVIGLDPKIETLLRSQLRAGSPVNPKIIEDFYRDNKSVLPVGVSPQTQSVKWRRDDERATVNLTFDFRTPASP